MEASGNAITSNGNGCDTRQVSATKIEIAGRTPIVPVTANDVALALILDTGAERTVLTPAASERVKAQPPRIAFQRQMQGLVGALSTNEAELRSFYVGSAAIAWHRVVVAPVTIPTSRPTPLDGLLGADVLSDFDIDLDLPRNRLALYGKQTCPTAAPDWPLPYAAFTTGRSRGEHLFFPVHLDGIELTGFIDTGAQLTALSTSAARVIGVSAAMLARDPPVTIRGATVGSLSSHVHRFSQLKVGPEVVRDPEIAVADIDLRDADIILGIDFIGSRRLWLSYGARRLFLSSR